MKVLTVIPNNTLDERQQSNAIQEVLKDMLYYPEEVEHNRFQIDLLTGAIKVKFTIWNKWFICGYLPKDKFYIIRNGLWKIFSWKIEKNPDNTLYLQINVVPQKRD